MKLDLGDKNGGRMISSDILFIIWFILIIVVDRMDRIFNISGYTINLIILIMSGIFLYVIHRTNMKIKKSTEAQREHI